MVLAHARHLLINGKTNNTLQKSFIVPEKYKQSLKYVCLCLFRVASTSVRVCKLSFKINWSEALRNSDYVIRAPEKNTTVY